MKPQNMHHIVFTLQYVYNFHFSLLSTFACKNTWPSNMCNQFFWLLYYDYCRQSNDVAIFERRTGAENSFWRLFHLQMRLNQRASRHKFMQSKSSLRHRCWLQLSAMTTTRDVCIQGSFNRRLFSTPNQRRRAPAGRHLECDPKITRLNDIMRGGRDEFPIVLPAEEIGSAAADMLFHVWLSRAIGLILQRLIFYQPKR